MKRFALLALLFLFLLPLSAQDTGTAPPDLRQKLERLKANSLQREKLITELSQDLEQAIENYTRLKRISSADKERLKKQEQKIKDLENQLQSARESLKASQKAQQEVKELLRISEKSRKKVEKSLKDYSRRLWIERGVWAAVVASIIVFLK